MKYLGVVLDSKLNWKSHITYIVNKATKSLFMCKNMIGKTWGLTPKTNYWMYRTMIVPIMTYASIVWWHKTKTFIVQDQLNKVQRLACLMITGSMKSTPTTAMEVLLNLSPLHLIVQKEARNTNHYFRISDKKEINSLLDEKLFIEMCKINLIHKTKESDLISAKYEYEKEFLAKTPSRNEWQNEKVYFEEDALIWFTDGSLINDVAASGVYEEKTKTQLSVYLGHYTSVFMAELYGIELAIKTFLDENVGNRTDNRAAIQSISNNKFKSKMVWNCRKLLNRLSTTNSVTLIWVPGHSDIKGNEIADELARKGTELRTQTVEPIFGLTKTNNKNISTRWMKEESSKYWHQKPGMMHSKEFIGDYSLKKTNNLVKMSRRQVRILTAFLTGHCKANYHLKKMGLRTDDLCRICKEEEETARHILCECKGLENRRRRILHAWNETVMPEDIWNLSLNKLYSFLKDIQIVKDEY